MRRYQRYKDSGVEWIGEIPEDWVVSFYKYEIFILSGFPFKSELFDPYEGFPILRIRDISSGEIGTFYKGECLPNYIIKRGDVIIGMDGDYNIRQWDNDDILLNQRCCKITPINKILLRYMFYTLPFDLKVINDLTYYTTVKHLSVEEINNIKCVIPSQSEQQSIVAFLDDKTSQIDLLISNSQKKIELLKEKRTALINHAVTKGLDPKSKMKDSGVEWIGEIPVGWEIIRGRYILNIFSNNTPNDIIENEEGICFVKVDDLNNKSDNFYLKQTSTRILPLNAKPIEDNILILPKRGMAIFTNKIVISKMETYLDPNLMGIKVSDNCDIHFIFYVLSSRGLGDICDSSTIPQINNKHIYPLEFPVPELKVQQEIVEFIMNKSSEIDKEVSLEERRIELLKEYRQSLISEVVTGKINVSDYAV
jgi:type I restriction enzyme S subunit